MEHGDKCIYLEFPTTHPLRQAKVGIYHGPSAHVRGTHIVDTQEVDWPDLTRAESVSPYSDELWAAWQKWNKDAQELQARHAMLLQGIVVDRIPQLPDWEEVPNDH